ncbi:hypothetical protein D6D21_06403 [Aureobasidium pullulans]|uniref:TAFII55 protein conserved region domain-containing protein n=1 Tax=Aureobasidium pullulans TaxID=5580 RepID=A0AB74ITZ4_AURPU|nr:hypothetical protein D6D21_06403 [Aureobasidium pullulans]
MSTSSSLSQLTTLTHPFTSAIASQPAEEAIRPKMKLKLSAAKPADSNAPPSVPPTPAAATPSTGGFKLKIKNSQPPTPQNESTPSQPPRPPQSAIPAAIPKKIKKPKQPTDDASKKRSAQDDISPAPKRPTINTQLPPKKKFSLKLSSGGNQESAASTPTSARIKLSAGARKQSFGPKSISIVSRKYVPKRPVGVGYDSEASDAEDDPAIEHQWILRMEPGPDCEYLREAIANKTLGEKPEAGGAYVNLKFLDKDLRRALVTVNKTNYAAVMVDLPTIVEGMKSWDKRGWWKVADICQMLLVLGTTDSETTAKNHPLPREVNKSTFAYAHGLTPPMHWVRKRRFRQRASYKSVEHVDDEVERLIKADELVEKAGGTVTYNIIDHDAPDPQAQGDQEEYYDEDEPADYRTTVEDAFGQAYTTEPMQEEDDDEDLEGMLGAALFDEDMADAPPLPAADAAAEMGAVQTAMTEAEPETEAPTPAASAETPAPAQEGSSDEDDDSEESDEDEDEGPDTIDEELVAEQAVQAQVREEIEDLEKEVANARANVERSMNPMLRQRNINKLQSLESELAMKRRNFGMEVDEDDEDNGE